MKTLKILIQFTKQKFQEAWGVLLIPVIFFLLVGSYHLFYDIVARLSDTCMENMTSDSNLFLQSFYGLLFLFFLTISLGIWLILVLALFTPLWANFVILGDYIQFKARIRKEQILRLVLYNLSFITLVVILISNNVCFIDESFSKVFSYIATHALFYLFHIAVSAIVYYLIPYLIISFVDWIKENWERAKETVENKK